MLTVEELFKLHDELCGAGKAIMESKNHDYRGGSGDPLANFRGSSTFDIKPIVGILLRVQDKLMRVKTFAEKGQLQVKGEGVKDALIDVINYMVLIGGFIQEVQALATEVAPQHKHTRISPLPCVRAASNAPKADHVITKASVVDLDGTVRQLRPQDAPIIVPFVRELTEIPGVELNLGDEAHPEI